MWQGSALDENNPGNKRKNLISEELVLAGTKIVFGKKVRPSFL